MKNKYTHHNNELTLNNVGEAVLLKGWVAKKRNLGGLIFIDLRDHFGITQLVIRPEHPQYELISSLKSEYVIEVSGTVLERENKNNQIITGQIEVDVKNLVLLNESETPVISMQEESESLEETRLKYRYLDLRRPSVQKYLIKRHEITQSIRQTLLNNKFYELETPILAKSTPEGARDYLVPSRLYEGQFYALPQSPQIFKQLYMVAGFEKYFQVAKCFRDEDLRADRQPEFTQIDVEASFITQEDIMELTEEVFANLFKNVLNKKITLPLQKMDYKDALNLYGSDKPDTRFECLIEDLTSILNGYAIPLFEGKETIRAIRVKNDKSITRKKLDEYAALVKKHHGEALAFLRKENGQLSGSIAKFIEKEDFILEDELVLIVPGKTENVLPALGALRLKVASDLNMIDETKDNLLWVVNWPLLEYDSEEQRYYAMHHPFTAPQDAHILENNPKDSLAQAYDIVWNGYEVGGGSIRIHRQQVQNLMFKTLGFSQEEIKSKFGFFVEALKYGTPPHGGIALGLDRVVMLATKTNNIKDVVAFPKTQSAKDLMLEAPDFVEPIQLKELNIKVDSKNE
ncbi:Aspartyl-tRNA synthetase [Alteracholeplasma palmae J233]|uniref:Aspartate--tRNA ligase n=1 Tax=Alteracholeplasma palmae (strain ATCC 49389 / J233) TaxID=1318466 RepID=U4KL83_ALTPJ|nr:aspartate--tRNA ligase [Alteracholeplasma palmae]CCV64542.1 Aspartyl-tRNA synthetase [Alteracholeplasma palmae J233]